MDYVEISLTSDDEGALERFTDDLRKHIPSLRFNRIQVGRKGDWVCYGYYDDARNKVGERTQQSDQVDIAGWFRAYKKVRLPIKQRLGSEHPTLQLLDTAIRNMRRLLEI